MASDQKQPILINVTNRTIFKGVFILVAALAAFRLFTLMTQVLVLIGISFFLALALNPAVSWIIKKLQIKSRVLATSIAYLTVIAIIVALLLVVVPTVIRQTSNFIDTLPSNVNNLRTSNTSVANFVRGNDLNDQLDNIAGTLHDRIFSLRGPALTRATSIGVAIIAVTSVLVMTFMMLVEGPYWRRRFWEFYPAKDKAKHMRTADDMYRIVTSYVNGQLIIAAIAAMMAFIALSVAGMVLDVSVNAVGLAGIVGIVGLIPMIGNTIAAVVVVLVCLLTSLPLAIVMGVFFLLYQQIENVTLQPLIQSKFNELTPLLVFIAALLGVGLGGLLGAFVAIPLAGCLKLVFNQYLASKIESADYEQE